MRVADNWKEYTILDASTEEKLESWNGVRLIRPDPQIIWKTPKNEALWNSADAHYHRSSSGGGSWDYKTTNLREPGKCRMANLNLR